MRCVLSMAAAVLLAGCGAAAPDADTAAVPAPATAATTAAAEHAFSPSITADDLVAHIKVLSSDVFGGRAPGSPGAKRTTDYLIAQFQRLGLQPGNHGKWLQPVSVVSTELTNTDTALQVTGGARPLTLDYRKDMIVGTLQAQPEVALNDSDIVFVGYGIDAPEYQWDDFSGVDVKGKTVIVLVNDPGYASGNAKLFRGRTMTYYGRWTYKFEEAARQGAAACFVVHATGPAGYPWSVVENSWSGKQFALPADAASGPRLPVAGWLTQDGARRLFAAAGKDFDALKQAAGKRGFQAVDLGLEASIKLDSRIGHFQSENVLAMVPGSTHPDQAVIYSAHWDHLGTNPALHGDQIYNGAADNATGVAALLEIAAAFMHQPTPPARSILFAAVTLEESGLLGSQYYATHPVIPLRQTVADINVDMLAPIGAAHDITVVGLGNSQLDGYLKRVVAAQGRTLSPEDAPEKGLYFRSDHFSFAKVGVPALYIDSGLDLIDGGVAAGAAAMADFTKHRYHNVNDEYDPATWKMGGMVQDVQGVYHVGRTLAAGEDWPQWAADSAFRAKRQAMMK